jgi:hypothetical protein
MIKGLMKFIGSTGFVCVSFIVFLVLLGKSQDLPSHPNNSQAYSSTYTVAENMVLIDNPDQDQSDLGYLVDEYENHLEAISRSTGLSKTQIGDQTVTARDWIKKECGKYFRMNVVMREARLVLKGYSDPTGRYSEVLTMFGILSCEN